MSPNMWRSSEALKSMSVDLVDDLAHQGAVLHVVVGVLEGRCESAACDLVASPTVSVFSFGNSVLLTKSSSASPVMPSASVAQLRQRRCFGSGDL